MPVKTAYRVLEIPENAPADDIKNAYRIMALKWHPDRHHNGHDKDAATRRFLEVTNAYRTLVREGRVNSPVAQASRRDPSPRRPIRRPPTPMVHKNSSESSGSDDSFVHMVRSTSVDTLPTPASSKRESLRASWGKNKGSRVPAADPMPGPSRGDASARQPPTFNYQPPPARGTGKGPSIYAPPVQPYAPGPPVPPQPMPKTSGRAPPASSSRPPPLAAYPAPSVPKPNPRQPVNNPPPTNTRPPNNLHPPPIPRPAKDLNPPPSSSRPPNNTRPPNNLQPPTNPSRPPNNVQPPNNPYPSHNLHQPTNPHPPMNPYPPMNSQPPMNSRPPMNPMNPINPHPPMNSRPPVNLRPPLNPNPPTNSRPPVNPHPPMNPHAPINPRLPMSGPHLPMNQPPLNSHAPMNANNRGPPGQDPYKHVHTPHIPPHSSHNPRNQKPASPYEIPLTSLGPGPSGEWAYSLPLTLEDIFRGKQLRFGITRAYLSAKTKLKHVVIEIDIPAGCRAGTPILCRNVGHERQPGVFQDIAFVIEEVPHGCFVRVQDDLVMDVRLPWVEGLRRDGGKVPFTGIDGKSLGFQIDFQRDRVMKGRNVVKGAGMPVRDRGQVVGRGNLIIQWEILPPQPKMMHFMRRLWGGK